MSERLRRGEEPERRYRKLPRGCSAFRTWGSRGQTYARISTGKLEVGLGLLRTLPSTDHNPCPSCSG